MRGKPLSSSNVDSAVLLILFEFELDRASAELLLGERGGRKPSEDDGRVGVVDNERRC